jgi:hypothetical protein
MAMMGLQMAKTGILQALSLKLKQALHFLKGAA